jgi:hypothetical protein
MTALPMPPQLESDESRTSIWPADTTSISGFSSRSRIVPVMLIVSLWINGKSLIGCYRRPGCDECGERLVGVFSSEINERGPQWAGCYRYNAAAHLDPFADILNGFRIGFYEIRLSLFDSVFYFSCSFSVSRNGDKFVFLSKNKNKGCRSIVRKPRHVQGQTLSVIHTPLRPQRPVTALRVFERWVRLRAAITVYANTPPRKGLSDVVARTRRAKSPMPQSCHLRQIKRHEVGFGYKRTF